MSTNNKISDELKAVNISLPLISMPDMVIPPGYFEHLSDELLAKIHTNDFLSDISKLNPFEVPESYFNDLSDKIISQIHTEQFIATLPSSSPLQVPDHYFENLSEEILAQTHAETFLASLPKEIPFSIPSNYFEEFTDIIISKTARVNKMSPLRATRTFYSKMSIAASLLIILSLGFLMINQTSPKNVETQLAQISDKEIDNYIKDHAYEFDNQLSYQVIDEANIDINKLENDIYNAYFDDISDEELSNFL